MKKLVCLLLTIISLFTITGCSSCSSSTAKPEGSYWLTNPAVMEVANVEETCTYSVTVEKFSGAEITPNLTGTYTTTLSTVTAIDQPETPYYRLESTLLLTGTYTYKEQEIAVDDIVESVVVFSGTSNNLKPLFSQKSMRTTSPIINGNGDIDFEVYDFSFDVDYSTKKAIIEYTDNSQDGNANLPQTKTFKNFYSSSFCENELLLMYPRMFERSSSFSLSLKTVNAPNQKMETIEVSTLSYKKPLEQNLWNKTEDGGLLIDCLQFYKKGTYSGIAMKAYYANKQETFARHALVKLETGIANVGTMIYTLTKFTTNQR